MEPGLEVGVTGSRPGRRYSAPMPRCVRSFSSSNLASASGSRVRSDPAMPAMKAIVIDTIAGLRRGNTAGEYLNRSTHTVGLRTISPTDRIDPVSIAATAPVVLKRRQTIDISSGGKFALQAIANRGTTQREEGRGG